MSARRIGLFFLCIGLTACSTKSASYYKTSEMRAVMTATASGEGNTDVAVAFHRPSAPLDFLQLTADDVLQASLASDTRTMKETSLLGAVSYSARFNSNADGAEFHVKLTRTLDSGAPDSSIALPIGFTLTALPQTSASRAQALTVDWTSSASSDPMKLQVTGACLLNYEQSLGTTATSATIPAGALNPVDASLPAAECDATITVTRSNSGTVDPAFASGSSFAGHQVRTLSFHSKQ